MNKNEELLDIVACIYDTVLNPDAWLLAGEKIRQRYNATYAGLYAYDVRTSAMVFDATAGTDKAFVDSYINTYCFMDPYRDTEKVVADNSHLPLTDAVFDDFFNIENDHDKYPYFAEYWHKHDSYHAIGALANLPGQLRAGICAPRNKSMGAYTTADKKDFELIRQAFHQAMRISQQLSQLGESVLALGQTIDLIDQAVFIVDQSARVLKTNNAGKKHFKFGDILKLHKGQLICTNAHLSKQLSNTIASVCNESLRGKRSLSRKYSNGFYELLICPLQKQSSVFLFGGSQAAVFLFENRVSSCETLSRLYRLTSVECQVLRYISLGKNRSQIAALRNTSQETVKSQLRSIFVKTGLKNCQQIRALIDVPHFNI